MLLSACASPYPPLRRLICRCATSGPDISSYKETFARRMAMAGIKPHHRIAMGVSGGPDSMALCVLTAGWKSDGFVRRDDVSGYVDGLLGIVVDHRLRPESSDEAMLVRDRVHKMGVRCEIVCCDWPDGRPKQGHLQEAARDKRYQLFVELCMKQQISVLLIAHHADDQAELLVLRLSRSSGVMGLAGMPFVSQLFPQGISLNQGVLLVRPMLEFSKDGIYKFNNLQICQGSTLEWVEDPTNKSMLFARNRIRSSLTNLSSSVFWSEVQNLISACRLTRSYIDKICRELISQSVTISEFGYATIDLEKLQPSEIDDLCLSHYLTALVQFIAQRHRPVRGRSSRLLVEYTRGMPCKNFLTVAGCNLSPEPGSKGRKIVVSFSVNLLDSSNNDASTHYKYNCLSGFQFEGTKLCTEVRDIIREQHLCSNILIGDKAKVPFLNAKNPTDILTEAKKLNLVGDFTLRNLSFLELDEQKRFCSSKDASNDSSVLHRRNFKGALRVHLKPGQACHFLGRFLVTYGANDTAINRNASHFCQFCEASAEREVIIRHMVDADWLFLRRVSSSCNIEKVSMDAGTSNQLEFEFSDYMVHSAAKALKALRLIPASARRALPVVVDDQDLLLSVPSVGFSCCPCINVVADFRPRVPLGGGHNSYL
ncbi:tRNA(Ile)-lysidine synthase [Rhynchospora pubera]|uniref:tRNA(Ile)-lysidine synthetase n=1 Tax=Rhynchospora pubera TaxID=906938 RepID=A0AAV8EKF0_9POAL|nr:tRNA(Ile)-lysidine synthase [Rhynchospora pubera]